MTKYRRIIIQQVSYATGAGRPVLITRTIFYIRVVLYNNNLRIYIVRRKNHPVARKIMCCENIIANRQNDDDTTESTK